MIGKGGWEPATSHLAVTATMTVQIAASRTIAMGVMDFRPEPLRSPGRPLDTGVLVVMAQRGEQLWEVVVVEGVVGVPALAADIDEVQLAQ